MSKSSQYPTQYPTSTGRSTGTWTCTCRVFWTGMCTWLSLEIEPQNLHLFMLRESHGALVDTSKLCWHWTPHILGKSNFGGSKFFEPYAHERQKAAEIHHTQVQEWRSTLFWVTFWVAFGQVHHLDLDQGKSASMGCITRGHVLDLGDLYGLLDLRQVKKVKTSRFRWGESSAAWRNLKKDRSLRLN